MHRALHTFLPILVMERQPCHFSDLSHYLIVDFVNIMRRATANLRARVSTTAWTAGIPRAIP